MRNFLPVIMPPDARPLPILGGVHHRRGFPEVPFLMDLPPATMWAELSPPLKPWAVVPHLGEIPYWAGNKVLVSSRQACVSHCSPVDLVTDLDFSPFDDFLLATGSADRTVSGAAGRAARCPCHSPPGSLGPPQACRAGVAQSLSSSAHTGSRVFPCAPVPLPGAVALACYSAAGLPEEGRAGVVWDCGGDGGELPSPVCPPPTPPPLMTPCDPGLDCPVFPHMGYTAPMPKYNPWRWGSPRLTDLLFPVGEAVAPARPWPGSALGAWAGAGP